MRSEAHKANESAPSDPIFFNEALPIPDANEERNHSSSEESDDEDQKIASEQQEVTKRRRTQNARFEALLTTHVDSEPADNAAARAPDLPDAELSTARLLAKQDLGAGMLDPREYQIELFEKAKSQNTIAVLDTGSGKTLIAVLLLKHIIQNELNDRAMGRQHRISFFLVDSVTLVYQQAAVLRNNIDQNVAQFFGAMGPDLWSKQTWEEQFKENMVIVCTAEILCQCLLSSYIKMDQINLLIFDEAHHTKKDHPYARIIRDSYLKEPPSSRPRIFGMTASPIDAKGDIIDESRKLETLLDSQIATTSQLTLLRQFVSRPVEEVWEYKRLEPPSATELHKIMTDRFGDISSLAGVFGFAWKASSELGKWCSERAWVYALGDDVLPKLEGKIDKKLNSDTPIQVPESAYKEVERIKEASDIVKSHSSNHPSAPGQLSPKVQLLCDKLSKYFGQPTDTKCIIFTERRSTVKVLLELFTILNIPHLHAGALVGIRSGDIDGMNTTFRQQFVTLVKFRKGEINCLFATSVAEEGLDIPDCNLVIRFDLYHTLIQYVQSRGRARHFNSTYASMVEQNNSEHETTLVQVREAERIMKNFCEALPEDRLLHGNDKDMDYILQQEEGKRTYTISATGAKLTYRSATAILARYASSLQHERDISAQVSYVVLAVNNTFVCEVILPEKSPVRGLTGSPATKKSIAKQSTAFDACLLLRKHKLLDDHFNSIYRRRLPAMRNAKLAITSKQTNQYDMISKPAFWRKQQGELPVKVYATVISFMPSAPLRREHGRIIVLTRERLPNLPTFSIFLDDDIETTVSPESMEDALPVSEEALDALTAFTIRVFRDAFHKIYDREAEKMPYWFAPASTEKQPEGVSTPSSMIDWKLLSFVEENDEAPRPDNACHEALVNRFVFDHWDGRYRYFTTEVDDSLSPSDPPPAFVQRRRHMEDIMNYCLSLSKNSRARFLSTCDWKQPVLRAELVRLRRNLLDRVTETENMIETRSFICLEPLKISAIPSSIVASFLAFPAIITRFDSFLIALEGCKSLQLVIKPQYALEAFTKDSDNTDDHRGQQIHLQRGMGKNYERLEFLGDCFLKMATSISLFTQNPDDDEFDYHVNRMCLVCNKNLFNAAKKKELYRYIRSRGFSRHIWYPEGPTLLQGKDHSKKVSKESKHALGEKTIADVCEALIGGSLLSGGLEHRFDMAVKAVTVLVDNPSHDASCWRDYYTSYTFPKYQVQSPDGSELDLSKKVEEKLGYHFRYPRLLRSAFTHPSYPSAWAKVPCYQRLEFLGDSLLDMVCVEDLFDRFPDRDPQWLTEHKMAMVSNKFLGALAVKLGLHRHLRHFSNALQSQITHYAEEIQTAENESEGAVDYWVATKDSPKCLPDMVEAYLGACFVDSGFDFRVVETFYNRCVKPYFHDMSIYDTFANKHPTTYLHNKLTLEYQCTNYCLKAGEIPAADGGPGGVLAAVIVHNEVIAQGTSSSTRYAKVKASEKALAVLDGILPFEFRKKYSCDCRDVQNGQDAEIGTAI